VKVLREVIQTKSPQSQSVPVSVPASVPSPVPVAVKVEPAPVAAQVEPVPKQQPVQQQQVKIQESNNTNQIIEKKLKQQALKIIKQIADDSYNNGNNASADEYDMALATISNTLAGLKLD